MICPWRRNTPNSGTDVTVDVGLCYESWRAKSGTGGEESIDGCLNLGEGLVRAGRGLQPSLAVDQENRRVTRDVSIQVGDGSGDGEKRISDRDLFHELSLLIGALVREPKHHESLSLMLPV